MAPCSAGASGQLPAGPPAGRPGLAFSPARPWALYEEGGARLLLPEWVWGRGGRGCRGPQVPRGPGGEDSALQRLVFCRGGSPTSLSLASRPRDWPRELCIVHPAARGSLATVDSRPSLASSRGSRCLLGFADQEPFILRALLGSCSRLWVRTPLLLRGCSKVWLWGWPSAPSCPV